MNTHPHRSPAIFGSLPTELLASTPGLEILGRMIAGELPNAPMARQMNFYLAEARDGYVAFKGTPLRDHYNPAGVVHGGWAATILDSALGCCVWTKMPAGKAYTTAEFKVNLIRPITDQTGEVICEASVIHVGRNLATCEGTLKTIEGKLLAHGTETCAIFDLGNS